MATYTRMEIIDLCNRLQDRANSEVSARPAFAADIKAGVILIRLMMQLADIKEVEIAPTRINGARPHSVKQ